MLMESEEPNYDRSSEEPDGLNRSAEKAPDLLGGNIDAAGGWERLSDHTWPLPARWRAAFQRRTEQLC